MRGTFYFIGAILMMAEVTSIEHPTLKVPYDVLNKKFRLTQKTLDREVSYNTMNDFGQSISPI